MLTFLIQSEFERGNCCGSARQVHCILWMAFVLRGVFSGMALELVYSGCIRNLGSSRQRNSRRNIDSCPNLQFQSDVLLKYLKIIFIKINFNSNVLHLQTSSKFTS